MIQQRSILNNVKLLIRDVVWQTSKC